jgi:arginyl-tRNA synthetase
MKRPKQPSELPSGEENLEQDFEQELLALERSLVALKERYNQVQADKSHQRELQQRLEELRHSKQQQMKAELRQIQQQLEALEVRLESQLFSWSSLKEPFWLAVRFGGLGVIIGWLMKFVTE